jgi:hypothetical protein
MAMTAPTPESDVRDISEKETEKSHQPETTLQNNAANVLWLTKLAKNWTVVML